MATRKSLVEFCFLAGCLLLSLFFGVVRLRSQQLPGGDEGSWLSVAASLADGGGFTTNWLEWHFLTPYELPRPDDFRFPGLVLVLGLAFLLFGKSYQTALGTVLCIFILFQVLSYIITRLYFGRGVALFTALLTSLSLFQLKWNTVVYTEGLFGVGLLILLWWYFKYRPDNRKWWFTSGVLTGVLFLIRYNGILFLAGPLLTITGIREQWNKKILRILLLLSGFILITAPWLIRNIIYFGNPFHVAGDAGLIRDSSKESLHYSLLDYLEVHGILFPLERIFSGTVNFFRYLHGMEYGMEIIPLAGALLGILKFRRLFKSPVAGGVLLSFIACCYISYNSWAGVRYFSSILPFVYAFGIFQLISVLGSFTASRRILRLSVVILLAVITVYPVIHPHEHFLRKFSIIPDRDRTSAPNYNDYIERLNTLLAPEGYYYAMSLCQLNFVTSKKCISIEYKWGYYWLDKSLENFPISHIALTDNELEYDKTAQFIRELEEKGYKLQPEFSSGYGNIFSLVGTKGMDSAD